MRRARVQDLAERDSARFGDVSQAAALDALTRNETVDVSFGEDTGPGYYAAVDDLGLLREVGWVKFPTLQHLSWAAQWLAYARRLRQKLEKPALVVGVFQEQVRGYFDVNH